MEPAQYDDVFKIIVVGDAFVGKTNIIHCYCKGKPANNTMPTVGIQYTSKIVSFQTKDNEQKRAKVQIWDTAGQQQYRSVTMKFNFSQLSHYSKAVGALIMFDITNRNSFINLEDWIKVIGERADEKVQIGIVGNKIDLESKRQVERQEARCFAQNYKAFYLQTSTSNLNQIKKVFQTLVKNVYEVQRHRNDQGYELNQRLNLENQKLSDCKC